MRSERTPRVLPHYAGRLDSGSGFLSTQAIAELIVSLKVPLVAQQEATHGLTNTIQRLTAWLLGLTVAIVVLTLVQVAVALKWIIR